jgi:flagellar hook assembly protein FlgD
MVVTQEVREDGPVASDIRLKTKSDDRYRVCFRLTKEDTVDVDLVDAEGERVRGLAEGERLGSEDPHCYDWDGLTDTGEPAPAGTYRARLTLEEADRVATSGERLEIEDGP